MRSRRTKPRSKQAQGRTGVLPESSVKEPSRADIAAAVRRARRALGLSQAALGRKLGRTSIAISRWENGAVSPPPAKTRALVQLLRASAPALADALAPALRAAPLVAPVDPEARRVQIEVAILRAAESADVLPSVAKTLAHALLARMAKANIGAEEAVRLLGLVPEAPTTGATAGLGPEPVNLTAPRAPEP